MAMKFAPFILHRSEYSQLTKDNRHSDTLTHQRKYKKPSKFHRYVAVRIDAQTTNKHYMTTRIEKFEIDKSEGNESKKKNRKIKSSQIREVNE